MASSVPYCDICLNQQKSAPANIWCFECQESLCLDCKKHHGFFKGTKNHNILPINEYSNMPDFILKIEQVCNKHNAGFIMYCHDHEIPGYGTCVLEQHKSCQNVTEIEKLVSNIKYSSTFTEIEETLSDMSNNIEILQSDRQKNVTSLQQQKLQIKKDIGVLRAKINEHLDKIQSQLINDLYENGKKEHENIKAVLKSLSAQSVEISQLKEYIEAVKKHGSDLQAFLFLRGIEKRSDEACKRIFSMDEAGDFNYATLKLQEQKVACLSDSASVHFGKIVTEVSPSNVHLKTRKYKQAQLPVAVLPTYSLESLSFKLNRTYNTGCEWTQGCVILPDGTSLFTCFKENTITRFKKDGTRQFIKTLKPSRAFDITYSEDMNKIFTSSGNSEVKQLYEMNLNDGNIKSLKTDSYNYGVVVKHNKLIYCARNKGLCERSLSDGSVRVIVSDPLFPNFCYVTESCNQLYYTNKREPSVTCCGMDGRQIWKLTSDALINLYGVTVDNYGNVYVASRASSNVVVISADGHQHREILSAKDGLVMPQVLYYQRSTNQLLVANEEGKAFLFDVSFL